MYQLTSERSAERKIEVKAYRAEWKRKDYAVKKAAGRIVRTAERKQ